MSLYLIIAFVILIKNYPTAITRFENFKSLADLLLFLAFIVLGYFIVFAGISSSSNDLKIVRNRADLHYYMAHFDSLTGIANRVNIINQLSKTIEVSSRYNRKFALILFDIDKFKSINDGFGHSTGDKALVYVVQRLQNILRNSDYIGRFGGDEFVIIQQFIEDEKDVELLINRVFSELKTPFIVKDKKIKINISIGVSIFPDYASDLGLLIDQADKAMYKAKIREGCSSSFFRQSNIELVSKKVTEAI